MRHAPPSDPEAEAAAWLIRLDSDATPATVTLWQQWLGQSARRRAVYLRLAHGWRRTNGLKSLQPLDGSVNLDLLSSFPTQGAVEPAGRGATPAARARAALRERVAALALHRSLTATLTAAILVLAAWLCFGLPKHGVHRTPRGGFEHIVLPDGGSADLNTSGELRVDFTAQRRAIHIIRGEAFFVVAPDEARPFEVETGNSSVRALGTQFTVRLRDSGTTEVLVQRGKVVIEPHTPQAHPTWLSAGQGALIDPTGRAVTEPLAAAGIDRRLAWTGRRIWLEHDALADAVSEFNRYNSRQFVLAEPRLAGLRVGGIFLTTDQDGFADALARVFNIRMTIVAATDRGPPQLLLSAPPD